MHIKVRLITAAVLSGIALLCIGFASNPGSAAAEKVSSKIRAYTSQSENYRISVEDINAGSAYLPGNGYTLYHTVSGTEKSAVRASAYDVKTNFYERILDISLGPQVLSITPNSGNNNAPVKGVLITGSSFAAGAKVKLAKTGFSDINADSVAVTTTEITCNINIAGEPAGQRDVIVTNPDTHYGTLTSGFEIIATSLAQGLVINSPNPFNPGIQATTIMYNLDKDYDVNVYIFNTVAELIWKRAFSAGENGGKSGLNTITWNGVNDFGENSGNGVYLIHIAQRNSSKTIAKGKIAILR